MKCHRLLFFLGSVVLLCAAPALSARSTVHAVNQSRNYLGPGDISKAPGRASAWQRRQQEQQIVQTQTTNPPPRRNEIRPMPGPGTQPSASPPDVIERLVSRRFGPEALQRFQALREGFRSTPGLGAPNAETFFDRARERFGSEPPPPADTVLMQGSGGPIRVDAAQQAIQQYRSLPGGIVLEGKASGLEWVKIVKYEAALNAFVLDNRAVYLCPIPAASAAILSRALAEDDKVGVSLGSSEQLQIVYGVVPADSDVAFNVKLADYFLGDIVFASQTWSAGYRFANGFAPQRDSRGDVAVFFTFKGYEFAIKQEELQLKRATFDARIVPLVPNKAADGGHLPDVNAILSGGAFPQYARNAKHVGENINYYLREKIIDQTFAYGEVAAFFRGLKANGIDLRELAGRVGTSTSSLRSNRTIGTLEDGWIEYLKDIQKQNRHVNWPGPPYDLYVISKTRRN